MSIYSALGRLVAVCVAAVLTVVAIASTASASVVPEYGDPAPTSTIPAAASIAPARMLVSSSASRFLRQRLAHWSPSRPTTDTVARSSQ